MILDTTATAIRPAPATRQDTLVLLPQDRERLEAEFAAIMTASGFGDRVIVATLPGPPHDHGPRARDGQPRRRLPVRLSAAGAGPRVRSPPGR